MRHKVPERPKGIEYRDNKDLLEREGAMGEPFRDLGFFESHSEYC